MVFQEESKFARFWPLRRFSQADKDVKDQQDSWLSRFGRSTGASETGSHSADAESSGDEARSFDIADSMEQGLARELVTEFMHPLRRSSKLWRFHVVRSEDRMQYRLYSDYGEFLMYAKACLTSKRIDISPYNPSDVDSLYDPARPAFSMSFSSDQAEWRLVQERCEHCHFAPKHLTCACCGKQQVASVRHSREPIGDGIFNCMEVNVPSLYADGSRVVWCPRLGMGDLANVPDGSREAQTLVTRPPAWNDEVESLVLDFKGRNVFSSAKNFQLALERRPDHVICQYGKIAPNTFSLDLRYPLSVVQAFGISLSTMFWT